MWFLMTCSYSLSFPMPSHSYSRVPRIQPSSPRAGTITVKIRRHLDYKGWVFLLPKPYIFFIDQKKKHWFIASKAGRHSKSLEAITSSMLQLNFSDSEVQWCQLTTVYSRTESKSTDSVVFACFSWRRQAWWKEYLKASLAKNSSPFSGFGSWNLYSFMQQIFVSLLGTVLTTDDITVDKRDNTTIFIELKF